MAPSSSATAGTLTPSDAGYYVRAGAAGAACASFAHIVTVPIDVVKTRMQVSAAASHRHRLSRRPRRSHHRSTRRHHHRRHHHGVFALIRSSHHEVFSIIIRSLPSSSGLCHHHQVIYHHHHHHLHHHLHHHPNHHPHHHHHCHHHHHLHHIISIFTIIGMTLSSSSLNHATQLHPGQYTLVGGLARIARTEGVLALSRGFLATASGYMLQGFFKFGGFEYLRHSVASRQSPEAQRSYKLVVYLGASAVAEVLGSVALSPFETMRIRMVSQPSGGRASSMTAALYRETGVGGCVRRHG
jgi:hypothetical protein